DEKPIKELVKDLQRTLLQADVNVELVLQLSRAVEDRSLKEKLPPGITRREHVVKVLYEEMTKFVGQDPAKVEVQPGVFRKLMLVGIQGTGKTTSSVKLARFFQKRGLRVGVVGADTYRPGALEQLKQLAATVEIPVYGEPGTKKPEDIAKHGLEHYRKEKTDLVIIDTAGRHRDDWTAGDYSSPRVPRSNTCRVGAIDKDGRVRQGRRSAFGRRRNRFEGQIHRNRRTS
ncbi:hypothetical protein E6H30_07930, partial [Candidatus Bathyarchaeota archaeon]